MKKITICLSLFLVAAAGAKAQDYKKVRTNFTLAQMNKSDAAKLEASKAELDKVIADPKAANNAETYLLKAEILGTIAGDANLKAKYPGADIEAFTALKKYLELDPTEAKLKEDRYAGLNTIYSSMFSDGVQYYNQKNWDSAFDKFKYVAELGDMFVTRKWSNTSFDTTSYLYAGVTAQNAKKNAEAAKYYGAIAEKKISGSDYESMYDYLTKYYLNQNDPANFNKYVTLAKEVYPKNSLWSDLEFAFLTDNSSVDDLVKKYGDADAANTLTASNYLDYGEYFLNNKKIKDFDSSKKAEYVNRSFTAYSKAYTLDSANAISAFNAGIAAYNMFEESTDAARKIKGTTPAIKAKRAEADKAADAAADKSAEWLEKAYKQLDAKTEKDKTTKNTQTSSAKLLSVLYEYKRERSKVVKPADYDKLDAKFKYYDSKY